jgi:hypothetical protein
MKITSGNSLGKEGVTAVVIGAGLTLGGLVVWTAAPWVGGKIVKGYKAIKKRVFAG